MKSKKLAVITTSFLIIGMCLPIISAENTGDESGPEFEVGLATGIWFGLDFCQSLGITVKNVGDVTAHNVTLIDLSIDGKVVYNNRVTEWYRDVEPGSTLFGEPNSLFIGFGIFTATMTVTCDEGVNGTGSGTGIILGPLIFVP